MTKRIWTRPFFLPALHGRFTKPAMNIITAWLLAIMVHLAPPERLAAAPQFSGWEETAVEKQDRYMNIAKDIYEVSFDPGEHPLFSGAHGRSRTAALLLSLAFMEGGFARDVDKGPCYRGRDGKFARCDGGRSACLLQIQIGQGATQEGWFQGDLFGDRKKCFRAGLRIVRRSFKACHGRGPDALLNVYASGTCSRGEKEGKARLELARRLFAAEHPAEADADLMPKIESEPSQLSLLDLTKTM